MFPKHSPAPGDWSSGVTLLAQTAIDDLKQMHLFNVIQKLIMLLIYCCQPLHHRYINVHMFIAILFFLTNSTEGRKGLMRFTLYEALTQRPDHSTGNYVSYSLQSAAFFILNISAWTYCQIPYLSLCKWQLSFVGVHLYVKLNLPEMLNAAIEIMYN